LEKYLEYQERLLECMRDHPRILLARVRLGQQTTRILGKEVSSWMEYEQPNPNEVEGGRRMSQRNKEKEGKSTINKYIFIELKTPAKTFSAEEVLQEMNEDERKELRERKSQITQAQ